MPSEGAGARCPTGQVKASPTAFHDSIGGVVIDCQAAGDDWRLEACEGLAERLRERLPGTPIHISSPKQDSGAEQVRLAIEWVRVHPQFVVARLARRDAGGEQTGPAIEFSVMDRKIGIQDARAFGRSLADSLTFEK